MQVDPIHQFEIKDFFPVFHIAAYQISFTNSALYMFIIVGLVSVLLIGCAPRDRARAVPIDSGNVL